MIKGRAQQERERVNRDEEWVKYCVTLLALAEDTAERPITTYDRYVLEAHLILTEPPKPGDLVRLWARRVWKAGHTLPWPTLKKSQASRESVIAEIRTLLARAKAIADAHANGKKVSVI